MMFLAVCAFLFALPFMNDVLWIFGYLGLSGLFLIILNFEKTGKGVLRSLFCFFFVFYFFAYSWFISMYPLDFVGLGNGESVAVIMCALLLIPFIHSLLMSFCILLGYLCAKPLTNRVFQLCVLCFSYVVGEYLQSVGELAFPWTMLAVGQTRHVELVQSASLFGSRFVTLIILFVNGFIALSLINVKNKKTFKKYLAVAAMVFVANALFGIVRVNVTDFENDKIITAACLQGNIPSGEKWSVGNKGATRTYRDLSDDTKQYLEQNQLKLDIAVLPETAFPSVIDGNKEKTTTKAAFYIADNLECDVLVGAFSKKNDKTYNSLFVVSPGETIGERTFDKRNLVPFGEFLPFRNFISIFLPGISDMNMFSSDIHPGLSTQPLETSVGKAACLVCFDSIFPENARLQVKNGAQFIVVSTNDSWYKTSVALDIHASHAIIRAVENGRSVVRSANTGISMIIDPNGKVVAESGINTEQFVIGKIPLRSQITLYTLTGDLVLPVCVFVLIGTALYILIKKRTLR